MPTRFALFHHVGKSLRDAFRGWNALFPLLMVVATIALAASGVDRLVRDAILGRIPFAWSETRALIFDAGEVWHVAIGLLLVVIGLYLRDRELAGGGFAVLQALILCGLITLFLKYATGRPPPARVTDATDFEFLAFTKRDLRVMWPSGHTSTACAAAAALSAFYARRTWVVVMAWAVAALVAASMLFLTFHWLSDIVAGALLGFPLGRSIGKSFRSWADAGLAAQAGADAPPSAPFEHLPE